MIAVNLLRSQVPSMDILCGGFPSLSVKGSDESGCPRGRSCVEDRCRNPRSDRCQLLNPPPWSGRWGLAGSKGRSH
jgi:hypothetical protein